MAHVRGSYGRRRRRRKIRKKVKRRTVYKYFVIDYNVIDRKCKTDACIRAKWANVRLANTINLAVATGKGKLDDYTMKLMRIVYNEVRDVKEKAMWKKALAHYKQQMVKRAEFEKAARNPLKALSEIPGKAFKSLIPKFLKSKKTKYIIYGIVGLVVLGVVGVGAFKLQMLMKSKDVAKRVLLGGIKL